MGLDLLELTLTVEDTFGFSIPDEDAATLSTMGKLHEYVLAHRFPQDRKACLSSVTFYKIRRAMISVLKLSRKDVRVSTELSTVIHGHRRRVWRALERTTGLRLPQLRRPTSVAAMAVLATIALAIAVPMLLSLTFFNGAVIVAILTAFVVGYSLFWLTAPLALRFQSDCTTVGQLATATLARNYRAIVEESEKYASDAEVWNVLCLIVAEQLRVRSADLTKETDFVKDLKAG